MRLPESTRARRLALALLILAMVAFWPKAAPRSVRSDLRRYYHAGRTALEGGSIYAAWGGLQFKYLPVFAQCVAPLGALDPLPAAYVWYLVQAGGYLVMLLVTCRLADPDGEHRLATGLAAVAVSSRFFVDNARLGQVNIPVAALAFAGAWCVVQNRQRIGGVLTGWAAALKFMPAVLVLYYLYKRRWRAFTYGFLALAVLAVLAPALTWDWGPSRRMLAGYVARRSKMVRSLPAEDAPGQSVPALLNRYLRDVRASSLHEREDRVYRINVADLSLTTVNILALAAVLVLTAVIAWRVRRPLPSTATAAAGAQLGLVFILLLLVSPEARPAHFVTLILPAGVLGARLARRRGDRIDALLYAGALVAILGTSSSLVGDALGSYAKAYGAIFLGTVLLAVGCWRALRTDRAASEQAERAAERPPSAHTDADEPPPAS